METITQNDVLTLVSDINTFADSAEQLITSTQAAYDREKAQLTQRGSSVVASLDATYKNNCKLVNDQSTRTIAEARRILGEIDKLDVRLSSADKYYVKTKKKRQELLSDTISEKYADATDYFTALDRIKGEFNVLYIKYSTDILPGLINGLNYMFSSKRKQDYEELIVLRNTVAAFVKEIEQALPSITQEKLAALKTDYNTRRSQALDRNRKDLAALEQKHLDTLDAVAGKIWEDLDAILPDDFIQYLAVLTKRYSTNIFKVNATSEVMDDNLNMAFVDFPVDFFISSPVVASIIKDKCAPLMVDSSIRLPVITSTLDAPTWVIRNDNSGAGAVQGLMHSIMFGFLSSCPVARLTYRVVDPENRGNSIAPFFDAKKKLPELFGERINVGRDDVAAEINRLNEKIGNILQDKLGNQYDSIFDYAKANPDYAVGAELLVLWDFPRGFDEHTLGELRNIIRNGARCGIYTLISYLPGSDDDSMSREYRQNLDSIMKLSVTIPQNGKSFTYGGLPLSYYQMPEKGDFAKFFSKYMLIFEGIKNRGIAFSPLVKKLVDSRDPKEIQEHISYIGRLTEKYAATYGQVLPLDSPFPSSVTLGSVFYPADIFSDSPGYDAIVKAFGVSYDGGAESNAYVELPLTFDLRNSFNLFLNCPEAASRGVLRFTHHVIWSFLSFMPVTKVNVCVFDPEQRGNSIIPFLDFRKKAPDLFDQKIYTGADAMYERLKRINAQIDEFIQDKLGNRYKDILEYNLNTPKRAEPVTLLLIYDFPGSMDGRSIDLLTNILRNGSKCGVFTLICYNPGINFSRYDNIEERVEHLTKYCAAIDYKDGHYSLLPYNLVVNIPDEISADSADSFMETYLEMSEKLKKQGLSFRDILAKELFSMSSSKVLRIPMGVGDGDSIVNLTLGEASSHHGLIAGATGSGKSTLLHTIIMSGMLNYSPDELHFYLMDFKSGTEFKIYESERLPHVQLLALDAMQEFGESILENLVNEMEERSILFKDSGAKSLKDFTSITGKPMPRILVIMDEFQILFNDASNRKVAMNCAQLTKRLVTEGRSYGIHLLMSTQSTKVIAGLTLESGVIEQMRIRVGLKCVESDARYLFGDNDSKALAMMKGPIGTAVLNEDYTEQANVGFRAAYCDSETQRQYLKLIADTYSQRPYTLQIFEGGRTTRLLDYLRSNALGVTAESPVRIHMGDLIKVAPPFAISVDRKRKHNMLICGSNERMTSTLTNNYIFSAALNVHSTIYVMDGDKLVGDEGSSRFYEALADATSRVRVAEDRGDIIRFIDEIYKLYQAKRRQNSDQVVFVLIKNLQFLDIVGSMLKGEYINESDYIDEEPQDAPAPRQEEEVDLANPFAAVTSFFESRPAAPAAEDTSGPGVSEKLLKLISDGSAFGIHFILSSMEYQIVKECMFYGENTLTKFPERVIFSLGAADADSLIEGVSVSGLRDNTVYYTDSIKNTFQLKPYITPSPEDARAYLEENVR